MKFKKLKAYFFHLIQTLLIAGITIFSVMPFSCKVTAQGIQLIGGDYESPQMNCVRVLDENSLQVDFSEEVLVEGAVLSPFIEGISDYSLHSKDETLSPAISAAVGGYEKIPVSVRLQNGGKSAVFDFERPTQVGCDYELFALVEDEIGNSLAFTTRFTGFNPRVPKLIMTELFISNESSGKKGVFRTEFAEFLVLSDGNLASLRLYSGSKGETCGYSFPAVEVHRGEVFVVHLRTKGEGCLSEEGDNLLLAEGGNSSSARDLWSTNESACLNKSSDAILLVNKTSGAVLDGILYALEADSEWKSPVAAAAQKLADSGVYASAELSEAAVNTIKTSVTKSFCRTDAAEIYERLMSGQKPELLLKSGRSTWAVDKASPGRL